MRTAAMKRSLLLLFSLLFLASFSYANLVIQPQRIESKVNPNVPIKGSYTVKNNYNGDITVDITAVMNTEWSYKGNSNIPLDSWLKITPSRVHIKQGETRTVLFTIIPVENMQGSIVAQVTFKVNPPNSFVNVLTTLPIHIIMNGTEKINYSIDSITIDEKTKKINFGVKNESNIIIKPVGKVDIYEGKKKIKSIGFSETLSTYPENINNYFVDLPSELIGGKYKAEVSVSPLGYAHFIKPVVKSLQFRIFKDGSIEY